MARKTVKTLSMTGITLPLVSAELIAGTSVEVDSVGAFGDTAFTNVGRGIKQHRDIAFVCLDEGIAIDVDAGDVVAIALTETFSDGTETETRTLSHSCVIRSVEPGEAIAVDGDRKATINITVVPVGGDSAIDG